MREMLPEPLETPAGGRRGGSRPADLFLAFG
jgi:hypothetical protein